MLSSFTRASAKLRHGAGARSGLRGLECFTARADGRRSFGCAQQWPQHASPILGRGVRWTGQVEVRAQARWFVATARSKSDGTRGSRVGAAPARQEEAESRPNHPAPHQPAASPLRKMQTAMAKARNLRENIYTLPNLLTFSRLIAAPFIGYCILHDHHTAALSLFAYAGITDALDGWIARRWNLKTVVGTVIDPMADKTLMTVLTVALAMKGALPVWLAVIILGRDVALAISALYYRWISLPPPKTFARYWDFSLPSAEVRPTMISKVNTALQLGLMGMTTLAPVVPGLEMGVALGIMQYVVATTTIWSGASYVYSRDAVRILPPPKEEGEGESEHEKSGKDDKDGRKKDL
ncbi:hypothetical protein VTJ83DRAFT_1080 [Remersonia thermophila]|uniref:Uncharacterized protein n=1 Tax=Remersonia thermophila TaxID=72144 RepID=A0ABR4DQP0_9PEZI